MNGLREQMAHNNVVRNGRPPWMRACLRRHFPFLTPRFAGERIAVLAAGGLCFFVAARNGDGDRDRLEWRPDGRRKLH